ncbi:flagellar hook-length control protein FliK [Phenylobacterium sp.]|uniref:flagellar hook-length control protein FliK n=1 Tax=Phenylobacterium sp. TaxID=1871053 RepID=UPI002FCBDD36
MTAPLLNLPPTSPAAGAAGASASGPSAQGAAAGFQVLLAAFFGAQGEGDAATSLFGETDGSKEETAPGEAVPVDASLVPSANADALAFAAQLAAPAVQTAPQPTSNTDGQAPAAAPVFAPIAPPAADGQAAKTALDAAAAAKPAKTSETVLAEPLAPAPAAEDVATPASAKAPVQPETKPDLGRTPPSTGLNAMPRPAEAPAHAAKPVPPQPQPLPITTAAASAPTEIVTAEAAAEFAPVTESGKEKATPGAKAAESARKGAPANAAAPVSDPDAPTAVVAAADAASLGDDTSATSQDDVATPSTGNAKPEPAKANAADAQAAGPAAPAHASAQAQAHASIHSAVRGSPETVANLAAQIIQKLDGRSTRFDVELNPIGLGQVNVAVEIAANGKMTAALSFETQHAANELRGRSADLQRALEQAGFDVSGGLSFDVAGDGRSAWADQQQQQQQQQQANGAWRGRAFQAVLGTAGDAADLAAASALNPQRRTRSGVDVKV